MIARILGIYKKVFERKKRVQYVSAGAHRRCEVGGRAITYEVKRFKRQRSIRIHIRGHALLVTAPLRVSIKEIESAIKSNESWIDTHILRREYDKTIDPFVVAQLKKRLLEKIEERLHHFNLYYGLSYARVRVRDQKTRWGSCSSDGNLNFNIHMIGLPDDLFDYIIVHELCHLKHMDHSKDFWELVAEQMPLYQDHRHHLKSYSL